LSDILALIERAHEAHEPQSLVALVPYARFLGVAVTEDEQGPLFKLPYRDSHIGNPYLPALHGGLMGAFMESAAILALLWRQDALRLPKVVDFAIDYLRPGRPLDLYARCDIRRQGKRVANVGITAWQWPEPNDDRTIATARSHFLVGGVSV
jgi:uncharacterized protein (TIGR00369 family)